MTAEGEVEQPAAVLRDDGLELFLGGLGRYQLLSAAEEVALAKRVERGDAAAKEEMVLSLIHI